MTVLEGGYCVWWQLSKSRVDLGKFGNTDDGIVQGFAFCELVAVPKTFP